MAIITTGLANFMIVVIIGIGRYWLNARTTPRRAYVEPGS